MATKEELPSTWFTSRKSYENVESILRRYGFNLEKEEPKQNNYKLRILCSEIHGSIQVLEYVRWYTTVAIYKGFVTPEVKNLIQSQMDKV